MLLQESEDSDDSLVWPVGRKIGMFKIHHAQLSKKTKRYILLENYGMKFWTMMAVYDGRISNPRKKI